MSDEVVPFERVVEIIEDPELATLRAQLAEANAKLAVAVARLKKAADMAYEGICSDDELSALSHLNNFLQNASEANLPAQAAQMLAIVEIARKLKSHDAGPENRDQQSADYQALWDALHDFDANRETGR